MTEVTLTLPDDLVQQAQRAGLLQPKALETLLREVIREQAGERLRALMERMPREELTPEIEQEIVAEVKAYRAERLGFKNQVQRTLRNSTTRTRWRRAR